MMNVEKLKEHEIKFTSRVDPFQYILIQDYLAKQGVTEFDARPGNDCVWVSYRFIDAYFFFKDGQISDIHYD